MIAAQSVPAIVLASITLYTGVYHLLLSSRRRRKRTDLTFALTCLAMGSYDILCAGLYGSVTMAAGMQWQRAQMLSLAAVGMAFIWFFSDYTAAVSRRFRLASAAYFIVMGLTIGLAPDAVIFNPDRGILRSFQFMGSAVSYREVEFSMVGILFQVGFILAFIYLLIVALRFYRRESRARALPVAAALILFFFGAVHDTGVAVGIIQSIYLLEYAYMGMVILMAVRLTTEVAEVSETRAMLDELETRFRAFFVNTAVGLAMTDRDGLIVRANPGICQMFGQSADTLVGQSMFEHFHPDDRPVLERMVERILSGRGTTFRSEKRYVWPDGSVYWGDISISTVGGGEQTDDEIEGLIWIVVGITERRQAVDAMRTFNRELENKVQDRTRTLIATNRRLEDSLEQLRDDEEAGKAIQTSLLPPPIDQIGPLVFSRHLEASFYMSGDFVDYFRIDDQHIGFYIADVSGHGVSSAFITVLLKSFVSYSIERFRNEEDREIMDPGALLTRLNAELLEQDVGKHLTLFYGVLDTRTNRLTFSSGGQFPYPVLLSGGVAQGIDVKGPPLGMFPFSEYRNVERELPHSFVLVFFSDGILEIIPTSRLKEKQQYLQTLAQRSEGDIGRMVKRLALDDAAMLPDDVSILTVQRR